MTAGNYRDYRRIRFSHRPVINFRTRYAMRRRRARGNYQKRINRASVRSAVSRRGSLLRTNCVPKESILICKYIDCVPVSYRTVLSPNIYPSTPNEKNLHYFYSHCCIFLPVGEGKNVLGVKIARCAESVSTSTRIASVLPIYRQIVHL